MKKFNLRAKFEEFSEHWSPKIVGTVNDTHVKLAKMMGEFEWHSHDREDEMFMVVKGSLLMRFRGEDVQMSEGDCLIVPRGVEHLPIAEEEAWVMMVEPASTLNTGNIVSDRTVAEPERI